MKYAGDLLKISLIVVVFYLISAAWGVRSAISDFNKNSTLIAAQKIEKSKIAIQNLIQQNQFLEACMQAAAEVRAENIFAYSIQVPDMDCAKNKEFISAIENQFVLDQPQYFTNSSGKQFTALKLATNQIEWVIVHKRDAESTFFNLFKNQESFRTALTKDILSVLQIMLIIVFIFSILLVEDLQKQFRKSGKNSFFIDFLSRFFSWLRPKYIKMAISANQASVGQVDTLAKMLQRTNLSLNSTILKLIQDDKVILPITFFGTTVCFDVNGYSKIVSEYKEQSSILTLKITEFAMELVRRYNGKYVTTAGDAAIVVFEKKYSLMNQKYDLNLLATAFVRDQMREYSDIVFNFDGESRNFFLKAGLAESDITFLCDDAGYRFEAVAFTTTKRLESTVTKKNMNTLAIFAESFAQIEKIVSPSQAEDHEFAGMGQHKCCHLINFLNINQIYATDPDYLPYFRSDSDIIFLLNKILTETDIEKLNLIFQCLSETKTQNVKESVISSWLNTIVKFDLEYKNMNLNKNFSRLIILGKNLIPTKQWSQSVTDQILNIPRNLDGRINASVIELLVYKNLYQIVLENSESFLIDKDTSFRAYAELLIARTTLNLSEAALSDITEMLKSDNKLRMGSGVYVASQIINYYEEKNPAGLRTYSGYKKIMQELRKIKSTQTDQLSDRMNQRLNALTVNSP